MRLNMNIHRSGRLFPRATHLIIRTVYYPLWCLILLHVTLVPVLDNDVMKFSDHLLVFLCYYT